MIAISDAVREHLVNDMRVSKECVRQIYNGIDINRFGKIYSESDKALIRKEFGLKDVSVIHPEGGIPVAEGLESTSLLNRLERVAMKRTREMHLRKLKRFNRVIAQTFEGKRDIYVKLLIPVILVMVIIVGFRGCRKHREAVPAPVKQEKPAAVRKTTPKKPPVQVKKEPSVAPVAPAAAVMAAREGNVRIGVRITDECWIQVKVDNEVVFSDVLKKGNISFWEGSKIELWVGNAGNVIVQVGDKEFSPLGRKGQVLKGVLITPERVKISE